MCFQIYLGSNNACVEISYAERSDDRRLFPEAFNIDLFVHKHPERSGFLGQVIGLSTPYQYHVGIMGCGCGFSLNYPASGWALHNHRQLADYVATCLQSSEPIELFSCWNGDESLPIEKQRLITLEELRDPEFFFEERQLTRVYQFSSFVRESPLVDVDLNLARE